jgi:hypothetical protein
MKSRVAPEPVRIAKDGIAYTEAQFMDYYGPRGEAEWDTARMRRFSCRTCGHECVMNGFRHNETEGRCERCEDEKCRATGVFSMTPATALVAPAPASEDSACVAPTPASDSLACALREHTGGAVTKCQASQKLSQRYLPCAHCGDDVLFFSPQLQTCSSCKARVCYTCTPVHPCWKSGLASPPW